MTNFKIGQTVLCIKEGTSWMGIKPIFLGKEYKILDILRCECGRVALDVGVVSPYIGSTCACGVDKEDGIWYQDCSKFTSIKYESAIKELVNFKVITETSDKPMKNPSPMQPMKQLN